MLREPVASVVDPKSGGMSGNTGRYEKRLNDLVGLYGDEQAFEVLRETHGNTVVYDVVHFKPGSHSVHLIYGVTRMNPDRVGSEFFLTRVDTANRFVRIMAIVYVNHRQRRQEKKEWKIFNNPLIVKQPSPVCLRFFYFGLFCHCDMISATLSFALRDLEFCLIS